MVLTAQSSFATSVFCTSAEPDAGEIDYCHVSVSCDPFTRRPTFIDLRKVVPVSPKHLTDKAYAGTMPAEEFEKVLEAYRRFRTLSR